MLGHYWAEVSYGAISLEGSDVAGPYSMPHPSSYYDTSDPLSGFLDLFAIANDCISEADPEIDFELFHGINLMFNHSVGNAGYGGGIIIMVDGAQRFIPITWLAPGSSGSLHLVQHEMGHSFGLPHSAGPYGYVYDNPWDVMSASFSRCIWVEGYEDYGCSGHHTIAYHKELLGWLQPSDIYTVTEGVQKGIRLQRLAQPKNGGYRLINIPSLYGDLGPHFTIEVRQEVGYDVGLPGEGVIIHEVLQARPEPAHVVDIDGDGDTGDAGAIFVVGETFIHPTGVSIRVASKQDSSYMIDVEFTPDRFAGCEDQSSLPDIECEGLLALFKSAGGNTWNRSDGWNKGVDPCNWYGITCKTNTSGTEAPNTVIELILYDNQLTGLLPAEIGDLGNLQILDLGSNQLKWEVPPQLGNLRELKGLFLSENPLTGSLPREMMSLSSLATFYYYDTSLCEPSDSAFQSWLQSIPSVAGTDRLCESVATATPTMTPTSSPTPAVTPTSSPEDWTYNVWIPIVNR